MPQTKDLNSVTVAKADASPTGNSGGDGREDTAKEQTEVKVVTAQVREPRSCGKDCSMLPSSSSLPSLARPVPSLPLLSPSSVMRNGALLRVEVRK